MKNSKYNIKDILKKYNDPKNFINRDLSWIEFNRRVLEEALNPELPLLDKIKFISIFFSNLDEFYMIRVSGLMEQVAANIIEPTIDGLTPAEELAKLDKTIRPMLDLVYKYYRDNILPELGQNNIFIRDINTFSKTESDLLNEYFKREIFPVLTPLAFDPGRPFPYISNLSLSLAILVSKPSGERHFARVKVPSILPRLLRIDHIIKPNNSVGNNNHKIEFNFIWLGDLIRNNLQSLFPGMKVVEAHKFRITRDTDIEITEDEADDLLKVIQENIKQRRFGSVVRLEIENTMPDYMIDTLTDNLQISRNNTHIIDGPLGLSDIMILYDLPLHNLKEKPFHPIMPSIFQEEENIFSLIKENDIVIHHPYESFTPVIDFLKAATNDPDVLAIKQTLYRVGPNSPIIAHLIKAAELKKQVAVLVELKARFDEENNIYWAKELEKVGVHVVYGLVGLKTHAKMTLVVRKEHEGVRRYVHLSTGNYNAITAKIYTDIGLFTANQEICDDVSDLFNYLTGYSEQDEYRKLFVAPINMRAKFLGLIFREISHVKKGYKGKIIIKINSLVDPQMIAALYEASNAGISIDLIVRGICCLLPNVKGLSENIRVISIVGKFLEHSRIYYFYNNGDEEIYLSSADLMQRNLDRRVETAFPILDKNIKDYILNVVLKYNLTDNVKARILDNNGKYLQIINHENMDMINSQEQLMNFFSKESRSKDINTV